MAEVPSTFQLKPGQTAPDFALPDGEGTVHRLKDLVAGQNGILVAFVCNHCPFVTHLAQKWGDLARAFSGPGIATVAINANDVARYPSDAPVHMKAFARANGWDFPYLYDETQNVAKAYAAACTPDFYLFDSDLRLTYAGQFDATRPGGGAAATGVDLSRAIENLLAGKAAPEPWYPSSGCSIKWKPGGEPDYFR